MRHTSPVFIAFALPLLLGALASAADAQSVGTILGYNSPTLRAITEERTPYEHNPIPQGELPPPPVEIVVVRGPTLGIRYQGKLIFLRGVDVRYQLNGVTCRARSTTERGASESVTGTSAGSGTAQDCTTGANR